MAARGRAVLGGLAAVFSVGLALLAWAATDPASAVARLDEDWHASMRAYAVEHPAWLTAMEVVTHLGDTPVVLLIDAVLVGLCLARGRRRLALFVALVGAAGWAARIGVRQLIARPRPEDPLWTVEGLSFPSGHAANSAIAAILAVIVLWSSLRPAARTAVVTTAAVYALIVGFSRVAGGVHWPSDVLGGLLFAGAFVSLAAAAWPPPPRDRSSTVDSATRSA